MPKTEYSQTTTADETLAGHRLDGQTIIVTGANTGIGKETARALAAVGAHVVLAARDLNKAQVAAQAIAEQHPSASLDLLELDLNDLQQVRSAAQQFANKYSRLNALINNAGIMATPFGTTAQGYEQQFGVCHLGHFQFTLALLPQLQAAGQARVVNLSSAAHKFSDVLFNDIHFKHREYNKWQAYGQAKSANALFSLELDKRYAKQGIRAFSVHPGAIYESELGRHIAPEDVAVIKEQTEGMFVKTVGQGAATSCWAVVESSLENHGGVYLEDCSVATPGVEGTTGYAPWITDQASAERLWEASEQMIA